MFGVWGSVWKHGKIKGKCVWGELSEGMWGKVMRSGGVWRREKSVSHLSPHPKTVSHTSAVFPSHFPTPLQTWVHDNLTRTI